MNVTFYSVKNAAWDSFVLDFIMDIVDVVCVLSAAFMIAPHHRIGTRDAFVAKCSCFDLVGFRG